VRPTGTTPNASLSLTPPNPSPWEKFIPPNASPFIHT